MQCQHPVLPWGVGGRHGVLSGCLRQLPTSTVAAAPSSPSATATTATTTITVTTDVTTATTTASSAASTTTTTSTFAATSRTGSGIAHTPVATLISASGATSISSVWGR